MVEHDSEAVVATSGHDRAVPGLERESCGNTIERKNGTPRKGEPAKLTEEVSFGGGGESNDC